MEEIYEVFYEDMEDGDLYGISIVHDPATSLQFVALEDQKEPIRLASDKKRQILYGIVLRPEQKIKRFDEEGNEFYIKFSAETIVKLSQDFFKKGFQNNSTFGHNDNSILETSTVVENWIVEDTEKDKTRHLGLESQVGDWVIGMKLGDKEWNEYIETGKARGFSIDSFLQLKKVKMNKVDRPLIIGDKNKDRKKMSLKSLFNLFRSIKLAEVEVDGKILTAEEFTEGNVVYDEEMIPFVGEFVYEGKTYTTNDEGVIVSITEEEAEPETPEEEVAMEEAEVEVVDQIKEEVEMEVAQPKEEVKEEKSETEIKLEATQNDLKETSLKLEEALNKITELEKELDGFKSKPVAEKLKTKEAVIKMTKKETAGGNLTTLQRINQLVQKNKNK